MYYEILKKVFREDDIWESGSNNVIDLLDDFIRTEVKNKYIFMNPYKLSYLYDLTTKESIQIFLLCTAPDKLFKINYFIDCPHCSGESLNFESKEEFEEIYCEECRNTYSKENLKKNIYILFNLNENITIPDDRIFFSGYNTNSTYDILMNSSDETKKDYPLSSNNRDNKDKGSGVHLRLTDASEFNKLNGKPICKPVDDLANRIFGNEEVYEYQ